MAGVNDLPLNKFRIGGIIPQLQGTPLTSLPLPSQTQPSTGFEQTTGKPGGLISPATFVEPLVRKISPEKKYVPFLAGLAADIATPGPGGAEKKVAEKTVSLADDAIKKLTNLVKVSIKEAKPLRREIEEKFTIERAKKLKGELIPEADKPTFMRVKGALSQPEIDSLFNKVDDFIGFNTGEKISTKAGLADLLEGKIPQPQQISHLEDVFGQNLVRSILSSKGLTVGQAIKELFNIPRSLITGLDASGVLRQSIVQTIRHPVLATKALGHSFKTAFSPNTYKAWFDELPKDPMYRLFKDSGGYLANASKLSDVAAKEERYMTRIGQIPFLKQTLGKLIGVSERIYTSYLNKLRFDSYKQVASKFIKEGLNPKVDKKAFEDLAEMVNVFTGRGNLGKLGRISEELNTFFFSPRLVASRIQALNPIWYAKQHPAVRKEAVKSLAQFVGTITTIALLAKQNDELEVELDPRSSDFMKIKYGDTRWDIAGGFQQWTRLFFQIMTAERKSLSTGDITELAGLKLLKQEAPFITAEKQKAGFPFESQAEVALRFARGKLAPIPGLISDLFYGANVVGEKVEANREVIENIVPFYIQDIVEAYNEIGPSAFFSVGVPAFFGVGVQTFEEKKGKARGVNRLP